MLNSNEIPNMHGIGADMRLFSLIGRHTYGCSISAMPLAIKVNLAALSVKKVENN
jgi:hypothetical protein